MIVTLQTQGLKTLAQVQGFISSNEAILFTLTDRVAAYNWMTDTLKQFHYDRCTRANKGLLRQYLCKVTGLSRAQVARCIKQFSDDGGCKTACKTFQGPGEKSVEKFPPQVVQ